MSELSFECPSCGQPLQCEKAYCGHTIHCPKCCAELRIPFTFSGGAFSIPKAELVSAPPSPEALHDSAVKVIHCRCPVCESELKVSNTHPGTEIQTAELIYRGRPAGAPPERKRETAEHPAAAGREEQIAAAREAHPVSVNPAIKPRMDYILSGGQAPHHEEGQKGEEKAHTE